MIDHPNANTLETICVITSVFIICKYLHNTQKRTKVLFDFPLPGGRVFRYQAMQATLHHLVNNPLQEFTRTELATITGVDVSSISRSVGLLEQLGVVSVTERKPAKIKIDQDHLQRSDPLFSIPQAEFRNPVQRYLDEVHAKLADSARVDSLVGVVLVGSVDEGKGRQSDIDVLVFVDGDLMYGRHFCTQVPRRMGRKRSMDSGTNSRSSSKRPKPRSHTEKTSPKFR